MNHTAATLSIATLFLIAGFAGCTAPTGPPATTGPAGTSGTGGTSGASNPYPIPSSGTSVSGSGATFPKPLLETWGIEYARLHSTVQVSYAGGGSGKGITDIKNKDVLFAGSDAPMSDSEKGSLNILHIPETLGLVAAVYNVASIADGLKLDGECIGQIYAGTAKTWDADCIKTHNPGMSLPSDPITVVRRSDSSGTTFAFTDFLARASPTWKEKVASAATKAPDWTKSEATSDNRMVAGAGNDGVASNVKASSNSIGYVEFAYVTSAGLKAAHVKNAAGAYMAPTVDGAAKAAAAVQLPAPDGDWSDVSISNAAGDGVYPISSFSYMLVYKLRSDTTKYSADQYNSFRAWLYWGLHDGQAYTATLGYAPLPASVVTLGEGALASIQV